MASFKDWKLLESTVLEPGECMEKSPIQKSEVFNDYIGLFLWRGTEKPAEILDHASYDYHKFTKLEISEGKTKDLVSEYWCKLNPEQKVEGLSAQEVKYFK